MDQDMALDLAAQFREYIHYTGDPTQFDAHVVELIRVVEKQCARVVERWPAQSFLVGNPEIVLQMIAKDVRGEL